VAARGKKSAESPSSALGFKNEAGAVNSMSHKWKEQLARCDMALTLLSHVLPRRREFISTTSKFDKVFLLTYLKRQVMVRLAT
jgi:hypothetical protein